MRTARRMGCCSTLTQVRCWEPPGSAAARQTHHLSTASSGELPRVSPHGGLSVCHTAHGGGADTGALLRSRARTPEASVRCGFPSRGSSGGDELTEPPLARSGSPDVLQRLLHYKLWVLLMDLRGRKNRTAELSSQDFDSRATHCQDLDTVSSIHERMQNGDELSSAVLNEITHQISLLDERDRDICNSILFERGPIDQIRKRLAERLGLASNTLRQPGGPEEQALSRLATRLVGDMAAAGESSYRFELTDEAQAPSELFLGIVRSIGSSTEDIIAHLTRFFDDAGFFLEHIRIADLLPPLVPADQALSSTRTLILSATTCSEWTREIELAPLILPFWRVSRPPMSQGSDIIYFVPRFCGESRPDAASSICSTRSCTPQKPA